MSRYVANINSVLEPVYETKLGFEMLSILDSTKLPKSPFGIEKSNAILLIGLKLSEAS